MNTKSKDIIYYIHDLSLLQIFYFSLSSKKNTVIYFGKFSLNIKILTKLLFINEKKLIQIFSSILNLNITNIGNSNQNINYSNIQFDTMEQTSIIADEFIKYNIKNSNYNWLKNLIGDIPSKSFTSKKISDNAIYPELLNINLCNEKNNNYSKFIVFSDFFGNKDYKKYLKNKFPYLDFRKNRFSFSVLTQLLYQFIILIINFFKIISIRGISLKTISSSNYNYAFELIDPKKFGNNSPYDNDFLERLISSKNKSTCFYLTYKQKYFLKKIEKNYENFKKIIEQKYNIIDINKLSYSFNDFFQLLLKMTKLIFSILVSRDKLLWSKILSDAYIDYIDFYTLFTHYNLNNLFYLTFPNGRTSFRLNDAVLAGLCNNFNVTFLGMQTRTIYTSKYEDCFDCFDIYFSWGNAWNNVSNLRTKYIKKIKNVGSIYSTHLYTPNTKQMNDSKSEILDGKKLLVLVFDGDISEHSHYTWEYSRNFIINVLKIAKLHSDCRFIFKSKEQLNRKKYESDLVISKNIKEINNFKFLDNERNDYKTLINISDIIISIGFTTPGFEALSIGKRSIYYNELFYGGSAFALLPDLVATNFNQLSKIFKISKYDYLDYVSNNKLKLKELDDRKEWDAEQKILSCLEDIQI